ncbi:MAG: DUF4403 family protein [Bacteroidia bacterium]|jgi:hypothetical protein|nr:DUF4403 family protein [Bacteroidia bacterium]
MKKLTSTLFLATLVLLVTHCNTTELKPSRSRELNYVEPEKPLSTIAIPITVNAADLNTALNQQLGVELYNDVSFEDNNMDNLKARVTRRGNLQVSVVGEAIQIIAPLKLDATYKVQRTVLGKTIQKEQPISLNITATIQSIPTVGTDWRFTTKSTARIVWDDLPVIQVAGFKLDLPQIFASAIQNQTNQLAAMADAEIPKNVQLREQILKLYPQLTTPILIDATTNSWFITRPKAFYVTPFKQTANTISFTVGIGAIMEIAFGFKPEAEKTPVFFLPPMRQVSTLTPKLELMLNPEVPFSFIEQQFQELRKDPKFSRFASDDYQFDILDAIIFPVENGISIGVKIDGWAKYGKKVKKIKGLVYVEGRPNYNEETQKLTITNIDYSVKTKDVLVKSASWLLKVTALRSRMEEALQFSIAKELAVAQKEANKAINRKLGNNITLMGSVTRIVPQPAVTTLSSLRMPVYVEGSISVAVNPLAKP